MPLSKKAIKEKNKTLKALQKMHPNADTELKYKNPFQLLVSVILSAQATDKVVNSVTPSLFKKYKKPEDFAKASISQIDKAISKVNYHKTKAERIKGASEMIVEEFGGKVPKNLDDLVKLPGVGRKTASVVLGHAYGKSEGVVVDTHVARVSQRLGWTKHKKPKEIEKDLMKLFPKSQWVKLSDTLILHGRYVCKARNPQCQDCPPEPFCPSQN